MGLLRSLLGASFLLPPDRRAEPVRGAGPRVPVGQPLTLLVWNIQFAGGRDQEFFYDGGRAVTARPETVRATLSAISRTIRDVDPDLVALQEVDRVSRRTGHVDQHAALRDAIGLPVDVAAPYHRAPYVPFPPHEHLGRVHMALSVFSRFGIAAAVRHRLPGLVEPPVRRLFNLRRAVLDCRLPVDGGGELRLLNTHLSAFSYGDGTLDRQVAVLDRLLRDAPGPWVLCGDFNALPPGDSGARLPRAHGDEYPEAVTPLDPLFARFRPAAPADALLDPRWRSYVPFGATEPDRVLDYVFTGPRVRTLGYEVLRGHHDTSDHLPLVHRFEVEP